MFLEDTIGYFDSILASLPKSADKSGYLDSIIMLLRAPIWGMIAIYFIYCLFKLGWKGDREKKIMLRLKSYLGPESQPNLFYPGLMFKNEEELKDTVKLIIENDKELRSLIRGRFIVIRIGPGEIVRIGFANCLFNFTRAYRTNISHIAMVGMRIMKEEK